MAKLSARGATVVARWRRTATSAAGAPYQMALTSDGRLLYKALREDGWKIRRRKIGMAGAGAQAAMFRMERA